MGALPKLFRRKGPKGKYSGPWLCKVNGVQVNLRTKVLDGPDGAIARSKQAKVDGRVDFRSDVETAAAALEAAPAIPPEPPPQVASSPPPPPPPPPAPPAAVSPDQVIPPPPRPLLVAVPNDAAEEAAATAAAAAETAGAGSDAGAASDAPPPPDLGPDVLDSMLNAGAEMLVELQLGLQAAIIKRRTGKIAAPVPADSKLRKFAADAWVAQLKAWLPAADNLPPFALALLLPVLAMPQQLRGATDPPEPTAAGADQREAA